MHFPSRPIACFPCPLLSLLLSCRRSVARSIPDEDAGTQGAIFVFRRLVEEEKVEEEVRRSCMGGGVLGV